jgi:hypothetical protein
MAKPVQPEAKVDRISRRSKNTITVLSNPMHRNPSSGVETDPGVCAMESKEYVNPFIDVHRKAKALKDRALEESRKDEEIRKQRLTQEAKSALDKGTG